jgi:hypothetical protein
MIILGFSAVLIWLVSARVTRDIQPGSSADSGWRLRGRTTQPVRIIKSHFSPNGPGLTHGSGDLPAEF